MDRENRRTFIRKGLVISSASLAFAAIPQSAWVLIGTRYLKYAGQIKHLVRCELPHPMSYSEFEKYEKNWTNKKVIAEINADFSLKGLLFEDRHEVRPGYIQWTYYFKDKAAFDSWADTVNARIVLNQNALHEGFQYRFEQSKMV
jgi:hypothetical protein